MFTSPKYISVIAYTQKAHIKRACLVGVGL